ncbi:spore germination protein KC [Paenibacillus shirakamiensis]|uniref:Spore germination protein KC n=1 Tax=Paenibacillus shirakamiensis TaxID=1265935 RepID=A0ABS4JK53_9BACL|nr:Ger(x)C family spore germination protein [Paenibacillus shirakamiensis]MBP2001481.1 spore germination protein KC [Paenibacillus shirakamiensis]
MRRFRFILFLLPIVFLTGCWSKVEIDEQTFVFGMYVDQGKEPGTVEVTLGSPLPNRLSSGQQAGSNGGGGKSFSMTTKNALTVPDALRLIEAELTRRLNFGHTKMIVVGHTYAQAGIHDLLDWLDREPSFHSNAFIITAPGSAKDISQLVPLYEQMPGEVLRKMVMQRSLFTTRVKDALISTTIGEGFATDLLSFNTIQDTGQNEDSKWVGVQGGALYEGDKLKGQLMIEQSRALAWAIGNLGRQVYSITWNGDKSRASVLFHTLKAKKDVKMTADGPLFEISLDATGDLIYKRDPQNLKDLEINPLVVKLLKAKIEKDMHGAIRETQKVEADVLQFGMNLDWKYPKEWEKLKKHWSSYYKNDLKYQVHIDLNVKNTNNQT